MLQRELLVGIDRPEEGARESYFVVVEYHGSWILRKLARLGMWLWQTERDRRRDVREIDHASDELALKADRRWATQEISKRDGKS